MPRPTREGIAKYEWILARRVGTKNAGVTFLPDRPALRRANIEGADAMGMDKQAQRELREC